MERARIQFLFGDPDVDPADPELESDLLDEDEDWEPGRFQDDVDDGDLIGGVRSSLGRVVIAQVRADDPPEVWATARRLLGGGLTRHQVFTQLRFALLGAIEDATANRPADQLFDPDCYGDLLAALPLPAGGEVAQAVVEVVEGYQGEPEDRIVRVVVDELGWGTAGGYARPTAGRAAMAAGLIEQVIEDLLEAGDLEYLPPDRLVHIPSLTEGIVLTHRLTEAEADVDVVMAGLDLAGFARRQDLHLPGGAGIDDLLLSEGEREWRGPDGWLDGYRPGALLAVRVGHDGTVMLSEADRDPEPDPALVARLRAVYDTEVAEPGVPVTAEALVLGLLAGDPDTFAQPVTPLATLCAAASLEARGGRVAHHASVWAAGYERDLHWRILDRLEGEAAQAALRILHGVADPDHLEMATVRETLAGLALPGVAEVVLEELIPAPGVDDDADPELIAVVRNAAADWVDRLLAAAASPAERALARWMAAIVAERRGEVLVADAHLSLAIEADPGFEPALERAAWYASDRGDASRALRLWRQVETSDPEDLEALAPFTRPAGQEPGRNEACWCGSGRKYKACHLGQPLLAPLPDRVGWLCRKAARYLKHAGSGAMNAVVACALARAVDPGDPASIADTLDDPIILDALLTEGGWFERFLADRGPLLPDDEALLAASWTLCPRSVYEIAEVRAGEGLSVVDLRTGDRLEVRERTFSRRARPGTLVCARAVPDGETHQLVGAVFTVEPGREGDLLALCDNGAPEELCRWVRAMHLPPTLVTHEQEPLVVCHTVLQMNDPHVAAKFLSDHYHPEGDGWVERFEVAPGEAIIRATFRLDADRLTVATTSEPRLERVLAALRTELPGATVISDERRPLRPGEMPEPLTGPDREPDAGVVVQIQEQMERCWLDEPVPALDDLTPRQAAADPTRREQLLRLLATYPDPGPGTHAILLRPGRLRALLGL